MIVSWNWLKEYVDLGMSREELENRLAMSGLNHEGTEQVGDDWAIDLEVTSNRPDCLGHIGVAREIAVLWDQPLTIPEIEFSTSSETASSAIQVNIEADSLCSRYLARVMKGVKVGPSPEWLAKRLESIGCGVVNNIVDITNYVMFECGQPLHAFDLARLAGPQIIVREATPDEPFTAIDHKEYALRSGMCVIADAKRPVALAGVMGGVDSEVGEGTTDLLIEAADFAPLSVRSTARALRLHSPSSYRFERTVDPEGIDWASRRTCQLIQEIAGGEVLSGTVDAVAKAPAAAEPVVLRLSQLKRILGIELSGEEVIKILTALGMERQQNDADSVTWLRPSWRRDLTREIDLVEEVARIHGYEKIPEDVGVKMVPSHRQDRHRVLTGVRETLTAAGFNEALTPSVVTEKTSSAFSPWSDADPIRCSTPMLRGADCLRRSLVPSLLESRRVNESLANDTVELFETAKIYLPSGEKLPQEFWALAFTTGRDFRAAKGIIEAMLDRLHVEASLETDSYENKFFEPAECCQIKLAGSLLGFLGTVSQAGRKACGLRKPTVIAELKLEVLEAHSQLIPQNKKLSQYPAINHDFNFVVDEQVRWVDLRRTVATAAGTLLESVDYQETYRDPERDGKNRKRLLLSVRLRSLEGTMTGEQAEEVRTAIITGCEQAHGAKLL